jgi:hypothetical protein
MAWNFNLSVGPQPVSVVKNMGGWIYTMFSGRGNSYRVLSPAQKLQVILRNPACLKAFALNADLFSLGKINKGDIEEYLKTLRKTPNYKQNWTQFFWDYMFWNMTGTAYLWKSGGAIFNDGNTVQWLNPAKLVWKPSTINKLMDFILTKSTFKEITSESVRYELGNGVVKYIPLDEITPLHDLSSGMNDNFYVGISRIDALYKIIMNSEQALDAKNINLRYSAKFMVAGKQDPNNVNESPMSVEEQQDIENKMDSDDPVKANRSMIDIKRFVDDMAALKLDDAYLVDFYNICNMYGIPRDIVEVYVSSGRGGSTYENQEKAIVRHIEYVMKPKGEELTDALETQFNLTDLQMSWEHLACYQVFESEKQNVIGLKLKNAILAKENNINIDEL